MPSAAAEALCEEPRRLLDGAPHGMLAGSVFLAIAHGHTFKTIDSLTGGPIGEMARAGIKTVWVTPR